MKAIYICQNLSNIINEEKIIKGYVHSVFDNACNIASDHIFFTLLNTYKKNGPFSIIIDGEEQINFKKLGLLQKDEIQISGECICCKARNIVIDLREAEPWPAEPVFPGNYISEKDLLINIKVLEHSLSLHGRLYGVGPLLNIMQKCYPQISFELAPRCSFGDDRMFEFIEDRFALFMEAFVTADFKGIAAKAERIIGFGKGLTPGMDDFISGLMVSLIYFSDYYKLSLGKVLEFNKEIISLGKNKTTKISSEMLIHSAMGEVNEAIREFLNVLMGDTGREAIIKAMLKVIDMGETSGTDIMLGIYTGCKIYVNSNYRRVWVNEAMYGHKEKYIL